MAGAEMCTFDPHVQNMHRGDLELLMDTGWSRCKELAEASDPAARLAELVEDYQNRFANPYVAAQRGYVDDVIEPRLTRPKVIRALRMLENKTDTMPRKKHGNIPL